MCLYPRLIENRKYRANKKNAGVIPHLRDGRAYWVPVGCQVCIECKKQKAREWICRLSEDIKVHRNGKFVTLTFSTEGLRELYNSNCEFEKLKGYDLDNALCTKAMRYFLERWRKRYGKSLRHWFVTELGSGVTEHVHMHGIVWADDLSELDRIWKYGFVWKGNKNEWGIVENYVNGKTINYMVKYMTKTDVLHPNYNSIVLCSSGIGGNYCNSRAAMQNEYCGDRTKEYYRLENGNKVGLPIYWRNKIYSDEEREKLWMSKLDKGVRYVCGIKVAADTKEYAKLVEYHRAKSARLGFLTPDFAWNSRAYEEARRNMLHSQRLGREEE